MVGKAGRIGCRSGWQMESQDSGVLVRTCQRQGTNRADTLPMREARRVIELQVDDGYVCGIETIVVISFLKVAELLTFLIEKNCKKHVNCV